MPAGELADDGADHRFVPDRLSDSGARAVMSLLVALGPGCRERVSR
jgi:hypothetical protein